MEIKLTKGFFIEPDEFQYILKQRYEAEKRDGEKYEAIRTISYHRTLEQAVEKYIHMLETFLQPDKAASLREYVKMYKQETKSAIKGVKSLIEEREKK
jgi:hypothetical protein